MVAVSLSLSISLSLSLFLQLSLDQGVYPRLAVPENQRDRTVGPFCVRLQLQRPRNKEALIFASDCQNHLKAIHPIRPCILRFGIKLQTSQTLKRTTTKKRTGVLEDRLGSRRGELSDIGAQIITNTIFTVPSYN